jgi:hypothetical protein
VSSRAEAFEDWIRTSFIQMNTALEDLYFAQDNRSDVIGRGDSIKAELRDEGHRFVAALLAEGNTGDGFESGFGVLGSVGMYLAALRRHELTNPMREERSPFPEASSLALHVGASLGMAPRFSTAHLATHNRARAGVRKASPRCLTSFCSSMRIRAEYSRCSAPRTPSPASFISAFPARWRM